MKHLLTFLFLLAGFALFAQTSKVTGTVLNQQNQKPVSNATVKIGENEAKTDDAGKFEITNVPTGKQTLTITSDEFETINESIDVAAEESALGAFSMHAKSSTSEESGIAAISSLSMDFEDESKSQNVSGILHSSKDAFTSTASYILGPLRFKTRGYDGEFSSIYMNGVPVNDPENGLASYSEWGGLNDATRNQENVYGIGAAGFGYGNIGGATNINTRASSYRKQTKLSYSSTNRAYRNRLMFTHATGMMDNGLAVMVSGSHRWAQEGYVEGTWYDAWAYFMSIEKKINEKHSLNLTAFAAPTQRAMQAGSTQEVYDLMDNNFYNPNWGYQTDENGDQFKRNAKIRRNHEPKIILNHYFDINSSTKLNTALSYSFGYEGTTSLNWYNSYDPRPDYYRYLPSYCTDATAKTQLTELWKNNSDYNQIDWDRLYYANYLSKLEGKQANYIVEERRDDHNQISLNTNLKKELSENIKITAGIELKRHVVNHYKVINDLLGADYWVDIDQFSERDFPGDSSLAQNDINNPNKKIYKGDRFGYDYNMNVYNELLWAQAEFTYNKFDFFVAANASGVQYWRTGNMLNGRNPDNSYGDSEKQNFIDYGAKGGFTYKITGRHFVTLNAGYSTEAPSVKESYLSPRIGADLLPNLQNQQILTGDISYIIRTPIVKGRLTAYHTTFNNQTDISSFYHDEYRTFVNFIMQDVDKEHNGVELGAEIKATQTISATIGAAYGDYRYTSRPNAIVNFENGSRADTTETIFIENFHVAGTPQMGGSIGIKYSHPKYWFFNANFNYIGKSYLSFNPERRTDGAIPYNASDSIVDVITEPMLLEAGYTVDVSIGKSLIIKGVNVSINFSVSNLLNNQSLITGGYEQMRYDFQNYNINKFPPKYFYGFGRNYFLNINVRF